MDVLGLLVLMTIVYAILYIRLMIRIQYLEKCLSEKASVVSHNALRNGLLRFARVMRVRVQYQERFDKRVLEFMELIAKQKEE